MQNKMLGKDGQCDAGAISSEMIDEGVRLYQEWEASDEYDLERLLRRLFLLALKGKKSRNYILDTCKY
jgi:hypothetical protein